MGDAAARLGARAGRLLTPGAVVLLVGLQLAVVAAHRHLPSNDGPAHQYSAWVAHRLASDPRDPLAGAFEPNPSPIYPNAVYSWFLRALAGIVAMPTAERFGVALYLLALPLSIGVFARSRHLDPWLPALAAAALAPGYLFFMGFFGFLWGVPLAFLSWSLLVRLREGPLPLGIAVGNVVAGLLYCAHLVAFAVAAVGGLILIASGASRRRSWLALPGLLPVAALALWFWPPVVQPRAGLQWADGPLDRAVSTLTLAVATAFGGAERSVAAIAGLGLAVTIVVALARCARPGGRELSVLVAVLLALALVAPSAVGSGSFLGERLMLFAWLAGFVALGALGGRWRAAVTLAVLGVALAHTGFQEARCRDFERELSGYLVALDRIPARSALYTFVRTEPHRAFIAQPMATAACYYHLALGSSDFGLYQAAPPDAAYFPVRFKEKVRRRFPRDVPHDRVALGRAAPWADYLLVWKARARDLERIERGGEFRIEMARDPLVLYRRIAPRVEESGPAPRSDRE